MTTSKHYQPAPFPLAWPRSLRRTAAANRRRSQFGADHAGDVSLANARSFAMTELERLGATAIVVTSTVPTRREDVGRAPEGDPGIAVWFVMGGEQRVIGCDRWETHAENLRAIGKTVEAMRGLDRWGAADAVEQAMAGFALPPGESAETAIAITTPSSSPSHPLGARSTSTNRPLHWRTVLLANDLGNDLPAIKRQYRRLAAIVHPDAGGRTAHAAKLNAAMAEAEAELRLTSVARESAP